MRILFVRPFKMELCNTFENADFCEKFGASVANCLLSNAAIFPYSKCNTQSWQHCKGQFLLTSSSDSKESQSLHWTSFYSHFFTKLQKRENEVFFLIVKNVGFFSTSFHSFSTWTWDRIIFCFSIFKLSEIRYLQDVASLNDIHL